MCVIRHLGHVLSVFLLLLWSAAGAVAYPVPAQNEIAEGSLSHAIAHAVAGGLAAELAGEDFAGGSLGARLYAAGMIEITPQARQTAWQNVAIVEDCENFVNVRCGGAPSPQCMADYGSASARVDAIDAAGETFRNAFALVTSLGATGAPQAIFQCLRSAGCATRLARDVADGIGSEYAGTLTLAPAVGGAMAANGGRVVIQYGDQVLGIIDEARRVLTVVDELPDGRLLLETVDGLRGSYNSAGDFVATNRVTPEQLGDAQRQLDELSASLRGQRNPPATAIGAVDPQTGRIVAATSGDIPTNNHPQLQQMADDLVGH